ncbi:MAG: type VI secretion system baseplate subunit TssK [bacterium]|nr:type VI secretion system baseplate subunit TssK [bacterium]
MSHLRDQDRYFEELVRWHAKSASDDYGLVKKDAAQPPLKMNATLSGNTLKVEVSRCQALLPCGMAVEYSEVTSEGLVLKAETDVNETRVPVYLGVAPKERTQVGSPDPAEEVPRIPYEIPAYRLFLGQAPNLPESMYIQIGLLAVNGSEVAPANDYLPPCVSINADDRLYAIAIDYRNRVENLLKLSINAYLAASSDQGLEGASTKLQSAFRETMHLLVFHIASHLDDLAVGRNSSHPCAFMIHFRKLFRVASSLLNLQPALKDYLNEKFFLKEGGTDIGAYLSSIDAFLLSDYDHRDIAGQIRMVDGILGVMRALMAFLSQTRLDQLSDQAVATETITFQGKTYKNCDLVGSRLEEIGELNYLVMELAESGPVNDTVTLIDKNLFSDSQWRSMQVRLGVNEARGLGETDPVEVDITSYSNKVVLHPMDMLKATSVRQMTFIFRGIPDPQKLANLSKSDLILYVV